MDLASYARFYRSGEYHTEGQVRIGKKPYADRFPHDYRIAKGRLEKIRRFKREGVLVDVGCGNGGFVKCALEYGFDAYGVDLYLGSLGDVPGDRFRGGELGGAGFARRSVDVLAFHDSLEHMVDPVGVLKVARGILKRDGLLVVDLPDMGCEEAVEEGLDYCHVRPEQHLWYFTREQFEALLVRLGFSSLTVDTPVPGKMVFYVGISTAKEEVRVYMPPGLGDLHWCLVKLGALKDREAPCRLVAVISTRGGREYRAREFLELAPAVDEVRFEDFDYGRDLGCISTAKAEYRLFPNHHLEGGKRLEEWMSDLQSDFSYPLAIPQAARDQAGWIEDLAGGQIFAFFLGSDHMNYQSFNDGVWKPEHWARLTEEVRKKYGVKPVILGKSWDADYAQRFWSVLGNGTGHSNGYVDLMGRTSLPLALAILGRAAVLVGMCAGITMLGVKVGCPTVIFWPEAGVTRAPIAFNKKFQTSWVAKEVLISGRYRPMSIGQFGVGDVLKAIEKIARGGEL